MGGHGGRTKQYTFQDILDDPALLKIIAEEKWGTLNFIPPLECIRFRLLPENLLCQQIIEECWGSDTLGATEIHQVTLLFVTLSMPASMERHFGVATVWCHPSQKKVSICDGLKKLRAHDPSDEPLAVLVKVFKKTTFSPRPDPPYVGLQIADDQLWEANAVPLSRLRLKQLLVDENENVVCPVELTNAFRSKRQKIGRERLWAIQPGNYCPAMTEEIMLTTSREGEGAHKVPAEDQLQGDRGIIAIGNDDEDQANEDHNTSAKEGQATVANTGSTMATMPKPGETKGLRDSSLSSIYVGLQRTVAEQSASEWQWLRMWDEFEREEVSHLRKFEAKTAQKKAKFKDEQAKTEARFKLSQATKQQDFEREHLDRETQFQSEQLDERQKFEASLVEDEAQFWDAAARRRLAQQGVIDKKARKNLDDHINAVGAILEKAPSPMALPLCAGLLATRGATVPIPLYVHQPPMAVHFEIGRKSLKTPQNSSCGSDVEMQKSSPAAPGVIKPGGSGSGGHACNCKHGIATIVGKHPDSTKDSSFKEFIGRLQGATPAGHAMDGNSPMFQSHELMTASGKRKHETSANQEGNTSTPQKKHGWDANTSAENEGFSFIDEDDEDKDSQGAGADNRDLDIAVERDEVIQARKQQWGQDSSWVQEARKALLAEDPKALLDLRRDCTTILAQIIQKAQIDDIITVGAKVPSDKGIYAVWQLARSQGHQFIRFLPDSEPLSGSNMGIQKVHNSAAMKRKPTNGSRESKSFCPWCHKYGGNTATIVNHLRLEHYKLAIACNRCYKFLTTRYEDMKSHLDHCKHFSWVSTVWFLRAICWAFTLHHQTCLYCSIFSHFVFVT